jgi:hypothetical protein
VSSLTTGEMAALQTAITAEQAASYGYGTLGPHLVAANIALARECEPAHRALVMAALALSASTSPTPSTPSTTTPSTPSSATVSYGSSITVTDDESARRLAVQLEVNCADAWRYVIAAVSTGAQAGDSPVSKLALGALTDSAVRAVRWRRLADPNTASVAFPGI